MAAIVIQTLPIVVSILTVFYQLRREWLLHSAEMVTSLVTEYHSVDFENRRKSLAALLERVDGGEGISIADFSSFGVLEFYENLGHLVRRRALDPLMIWNEFSVGLMCSFQCLVLGENALRKLREQNGDPTLYEEMEWLNARFVKIFRKRDVSVYGKDGRVRWLKDFFLEESRLGSYASSSQGHFPTRYRRGYHRGVSSLLTQPERVR